MRFSVWTVLLSLVVLASCRKNDATPINPVDPPVTGTAEDRLKDSALAYSRDVYLWNNQIPADFDARSYAGFDKIMQAIRAYSIEPGFNDPVDVYSFAVKKEVWDDVSAGISSDFGMSAFFYRDNDLRVRSVEAMSPAGVAGVRRGWKFISVAGSSNIHSDNAEFLVQNIYRSPTTSFTFEKPDGSQVDLTLNAGTYQENPIQLDTVYQLGGKKAGYLVFNSFLGDTKQVEADFQEIFSTLASEGVTDMIVDLRYNGGGYVSLQEKLANYLVKSSADGSLMMTQEYNNNYKKYNETTTFRKLGSLNVNNIYFIVSDNTASASELLINNLKPYMNVKLVGPEPTYGKPVGFFPIEVGDSYIFPVSFRSVNGQGQGNYFNGFEVDQLVGDGLDQDWGDSRESALATVLSHIQTGAFARVPVSPGLNSTLESSRKAGNKKLNRDQFRGAVETR